MITVSYVMQLNYLHELNIKFTFLSMGVVVTNEIGNPFSNVLQVVQG